MSKTLLKTRDIEALALSTLTGSVEIQTLSAPPPQRTPAAAVGAGRQLLRFWAVLG